MIDIIVIVFAIFFIKGFLDILVKYFSGDESSFNEKYKQK